MINFVSACTKCSFSPKNTSYVVTELQTFLRPKCSSKPGIFFELPSPKTYFCTRCPDYVPHVFSGLRSQTLLELPKCELRALFAEKFHQTKPREIWCSTFEFPNLVFFELRARNSVLCTRCQKPAMFHRTKTREIWCLASLRPQTLVLNF